MSSMVLLSGGMDSTTALAQVLCQDSAAVALSVDYGQRHVRELDAAHQIAAHFGVQHVALDLSSWGRHLYGSALTDDAVPVPHGHYAAQSMRATIVPNRNGTLLMAAVGVAIARGCQRVVTAVHAGDHPIYPDCRPEFIAALNNAIALGTQAEVQVEAPFSDRTKTQIVALGSELGAPLDLSWSCYEGGRLHCGRCGACTERREAFAQAGVPDPTAYIAAGPQAPEAGP